MFEHPDCQDITTDGNDDRTIYENMAERLKSSFLYSPERRLQRLLLIAEKLKAREVLYLLQKNCSFLPRTVPLFKEGFSKNGISLKVMSCDVVEKP